MKATQKQLLEFAQAAGVEAVEIVEDEAQSDFNMDTALQAVDSAREGIIRPRIETQLRDTIEKEISGLNGGKLDAWLVEHTGIKRADLKGLTDPQKVKAAKDFLVNQLEGDKQATQAKIEELRSTMEAERLEAVRSVEQERDQWKGKYIDRDLLEALQTELKGAPLPEKLDRSIAAKDLKSHLSELYHIQYNEQTKAIELFDKANTTMPALNGSQKVKIMDEAKAFFEPRNNWMTDMRGANPAAATNSGANAQAIPFGTPPAKGDGQATSYQDQLTATVNQMAMAAGAPVLK